jgi:hypothetical protein
MALLSRPRIVCLPSWDGEFGVAVDALIAARPDIDSPPELEVALGSSYPLVRVHESELSGLRTPTWYVYRDGTFPSSPMT